MNCAQCDNPTDGCKATLVGTPLCARCEAAYSVVDERLKSVNASHLCKPITKPVSSADRAVFMLDLETAKRYHDEAVRRALAWGKKHLPAGEPKLPVPEELQWAQEVWG
jgi:hypothetical protein